MLAIRQISLNLAQRDIPRGRRREILVAWWTMHWKPWSGFACEFPVLFLPAMLAGMLYEEHLELLADPFWNEHLFEPCVFLGGLLIGVELMARFFYLPRLQELDDLVGNESGE